MKSTAFRISTGSNLHGPCYKEVTRVKKSVSPFSLSSGILLCREGSQPLTIFPGLVPGTLSRREGFQNPHNFPSTRPWNSIPSGGFPKPSQFSQHLSLTLYPVGRVSKTLPIFPALVLDTLSRREGFQNPYNFPRTCPWHSIPSGGFPKPSQLSQHLSLTLYPVGRVSKTLTIFPALVPGTLSCREGFQNPHNFPSTRPWHSKRS